MPGSVPTKQTTLSFAKWKKRPLTSEITNVQESRIVRQRSNGDTEPDDSDHHQSVEGLTTNGVANERRPARASPSASLSRKSSVNTASTDEKLSDSHGETPTIASLGQVQPAGDLPIAVPFKGSHRIVKKGEKMVTNSDEDDDDASSLEDLDVLFGRYESKTEPAVSSGAAQLSGSKQEEHKPSPKPRPQRGSVRRKTGVHSPSVPKKAEPRYSLGYLVDQQNKFKKSEQDVARVDAILTAAEEPRATAGAHGQTSENLLRMVMADDRDSEEVERLKSALQNTEALHRKLTWSFFREVEDEGKASCPQMPAVRDSQFQKMAGDPLQRQLAFANGFVGEYARINTLSEELVVWMINMAYMEDSEDLREAYIQTLMDSGPQIRPFVTQHLIQEAFHHLGASNAALDVNLPLQIEPPRKAESEREISPKLVSLVKLFEVIPSFIKDDVKVFILILLSRLLLDDLVIHDCDLMPAIERTAINLVETLSDLKGINISHTHPCQARLPVGLPQIRSIVQAVTKSVKDMTFRLRILKYFPTSTHKTALLRRELAVAFLFSDRTDSTYPASFSVDNVEEYLRQPSLNVDSTTDYGEFSSSIGILNIAMDSGDVAPVSSDSQMDHHEFNRTVDRVAARIKEVSAQIIDTGALNMGRTEAKEALDSLLRRLCYTVRSEPPAKKTILGDSVDLYASERAGMNNWVAKNESSNFNRPLSILDNG